MTGEEYVLNEYKFRAVKGFDSDTNKKGVESDFALQLGDAMSQGHFRRGEGGIMYFDGLRYVRYEDDELSEFIQQVLKKQQYSAAYQIYSIGTIKRSLFHCRGIAKFSPNKRYLNFINGYYDFEYDRFTEGHDPAIDTGIYIPHVYKTGLRGRKFKDFLNNVLPDKDTQSFLQEACGAMFLDRLKYKIEGVFYLLGSGANGKSTFTELLGYMLGRDNLSHYSMAQICDENRGEYYRASIAGKVANICTDMGKKDFGDNGVYKIIASGEPMECRYPTKPPFVSHQVPLIFANVNEMPYSSDQSHGYHRRNEVIPFNITIAKKDQNKELSAELREEISIFIEWVLDGTRRLKKNKGVFTISQQVEEAKENAKIASNNFLFFLSEQGLYLSETNPDYKYEEKTYMYNTICEEYEKFCKENGLSAKSRRKVSVELASFGLEKRRCFSGLYYVFLKRIDENEQFDEEVEEDIWNEKENESKLPF